MPSKKHHISIGVILIAVVALLVGVFWTNKDGRDYPVARVERGVAVQAVYATGVIEPVHWAQISPQLSGRIVDVLVREGDMVEKGQILARQDTSVERKHVEEHQMRLSYLRNELARQNKLLKRGHVSQSKIDVLKNDVATTRANLHAQQGLVDRLSVRSPLDGRILKRDIEIGEMATPAATLFWVGQSKPLRITAEVDEEDIPQVVVGQEVLIKADAFPDKAMKGRIAEITPKGDPISKNFRVRVSLPDDTPLLIGMTVEINIIVKEDRSALLVPSSSLVNGHVLLDLSGDVTRHRVTIGISVDSGAASCCT